MNNQMQNALVTAHGEEQTSEQLTARLSELRAKRVAMSEESEKAATALSEAQSSLDFSKPKSLDAATHAQARANVIEGALVRLGGEIASLEVEAEEARAREQREQARGELAALRVQFQAQTTDLKAQSLEAARRFEVSLNTLLEGMEANFHTAMQVQRKRGELGEVQGMLGFEYNFTEGHMADTLVESGLIKSTIIPVFIGAIQALRFARSLEENGLQLYNDAPRTTALDAMPPDTKQRLPSVDITERPTTPPREPVSMATKEMNDNVWVDTKVAEDRQRNSAGKSR